MTKEQLDTIRALHAQGYGIFGTDLRALLDEVEQLTAELCRMKSRPCETEFSHLDVMWQQLVRERDKAVFEVQRLRALPVHENK